MSKVITLVKGNVQHKVSGKQAQFGELIATAATLPLTATQPTL